MNIKAFSLVAAASLAAGAIGGALGYGVASAQGGKGYFPTATYAPVNSNVTSYVIAPDDLKAIRVTGENLDYWFVDEKTNKEAVVRIPVRIMVGKIKAGKM